MIEDGLVDVTITTSIGEVYSEADFENLLSLAETQMSV
jgi:hypothetical protein